MLRPEETGAREQEIPNLEVSDGPRMRRWWQMDAATMRAGRSFRRWQSRALFQQEDAYHEGGYELTSSQQPV